MRRDAEHAARSDIRVQISRFIRRMDEQAKAHIAAAIEAAEATGDRIDGLAIGREAASRAIASYVDTGSPESAIDSTAHELPSASSDS